jgi:hypothetical protein
MGVKGERRACEADVEGSVGFSVCVASAAGLDSLLEHDLGDSGVFGASSELCVELMEVSSDMSWALNELSRSSW